MKKLMIATIFLLVPFFTLSSCTPSSSSSVSSASTSSDGIVLDQEFVDSALPKTFVTGLNQVYRDILLPRYINKDDKIVNISWSEDVEAITIGDYNDRYLLADVVRPNYGAEPILYHLTATLEYNGKTANKTYHGYIMPIRYS